MGDDAANIRVLIERAQKGDHGAFEDLFNAYYSPIYRYIYTRIRDRSAAEDLTQDVFIKVFTALPSFRLTDASPLAYWYAIARNAIIDYRRKKHPVSMDDPEECMAVDEAPTPDVEHMRHQETRQLRHCFGLLSDEQQEVLTLRYAHDLPYRDISSIVGKTEAAVRQIQSRAIKELRNIYASRYDTSI